MLFEIRRRVDDQDLGALVVRSADARVGGKEAGLAGCISNFWPRLDVRVAFEQVAHCSIPCASGQRALAALDLAYQDFTCFAPTVRARSGGNSACGVIGGEYGCTSLA